MNAPALLVLACSVLDLWSSAGIAHNTLRWDVSVSGQSVPPHRGPQLSSKTGNGASAPVLPRQTPSTPLLLQNAPTHLRAPVLIFPPVLLVAGVRNQESGRRLLDLDGSLRLGLASLDHVGHDEEVREEQQQRHDVVEVGYGDIAGAGLAVGVHHVGCLGVHQHELHHLAHSQCRLPPDLLGVQADEVVRVHHRVDEAVQADGEVNVAVVADIDEQPVEQEYTGVVVDVQKAELLPPLLQDDEPSV
eukprot:CAMPEP_0173177752 /NCGR_PEP_ID=MMETSP1141-20130122/5159_1 /TAXON_ID=483371 /ORGANISM="non described non described, Strain CCMP2298" /LENGTH=245 /DNA_ID=CAMNT_0014100175 /DNA_START=50 /DNA_END=787 /DNA_ORIENTATION=-